MLLPGTVDASMAVVSCADRGRASPAALGRVVLSLMMIMVETAARGGSAEPSQKPLVTPDYIHPERTLTCPFRQQVPASMANNGDQSALLVAAKPPVRAPRLRGQYVRTVPCFSSALPRCNLKHRRSPSRDYEAQPWKGGTFAAYRTTLITLASAPPGTRGI